VVKCIAHNLSSAATNDEPSTLEDERDVKWTMEVKLKPFLSSLKVGSGKLYSVLTISLENGTTHGCFTPQNLSKASTYTHKKNTK